MTLIQHIRQLEAREMHLAIYGMFLALSGLQPIEHLPWHEQLAVEAGANEIDPPEVSCGVI